MSTSKAVFLKIDAPITESTQAKSRMFLHSTFLSFLVVDFASVDDFLFPDEVVGLPRFLPTWEITL